jgi:hypothetical protein
MSDWGSPEHKAGYRALGLSNAYRDLVMHLVAFQDRVKHNEAHLVAPAIIDAQIHAFEQYAKWYLIWLEYSKKRAQEAT